jgi:predicted  nucleic acid-binding Zn-ribbon protein
MKHATWILNQYAKLLHKLKCAKEDLATMTRARDGLFQEYQHGQAYIERLLAEKHVLKQDADELRARIKSMAPEKQFQVRANHEQSGMEWAFPITAVRSFNGQTVISVNVPKGFSS